MNRRASDRRRLDWRLIVSIVIGVAGGLLLLSLTQAVLARLRDLLVAILVSVFLSFAMEPAVKWLSERGVRRGLATALVFFAAFLAVVGFFAAMAPLVAAQVRTLVEQGPQIIEGLADQASRLPGGLGDSVSEWLDEATVPGGGGIGRRVGGGLLGFGETLVSALIQFLIVLLVTFYLVADGPRLRTTISSRLPSERQADFLAVWELGVAKTGGYVYGRLLVAVAAAVFHGVVFGLIGVPYAAALGVWVGVVSSLIPVVGTYIGGALPIVVALATEPIMALWVLVTIVVYQQLENYYLAPRITAHTMQLHPAVAFLSVLAGAALLGAPGALLALPAAAIIGGLISAAEERHGRGAAQASTSNARSSSPARS